MCIFKNGKSNVRSFQNHRRKAETYKWSLNNPVNKNKQMQRSIKFIEKKNKQKNHWHTIPGGRDVNCGQRAGCTILCSYEITAEIFLLWCALPELWQSLNTWNPLPLSLEAGWACVATLTSRMWQAQPCMTFNAESQVRCSLSLVLHWGHPVLGSCQKKPASAEAECRCVAGSPSKTPSLGSVSGPGQWPNKTSDGSDSRHQSGAEMLSLCLV